MFNAFFSFVIKDGSTALHYAASIENERNNVSRRFDLKMHLEYSMCISSVENIVVYRTMQTQCLTNPLTVNLAVYPDKPLRWMTVATLN